LTFTAVSGEFTVKYHPVQRTTLTNSSRDLPNLRRTLPDLAGTAPDSVKLPFMKTSKLLLAYGVELEVRIKAGCSVSLATVLADESFSILGLHPTEKQVQGDAARIKGDAAGPVLLAVLAEKC
jgi:hypothetical protein